MLRAASVSTLLDLLSELPVPTLQIFKLFLGNLSRRDVAGPEGDRVDAFATIRFKDTVWLKSTDGEPNFIHLANVPIANSAEITKAHVVSIDFTNLLSANFDIATDIVLRLHAVLSRLVLCDNLVSLVDEGDLAGDLVAHVAHQHVEQVVTRRIVLNSLSVLELEDLASGCRQ